jgi:predicted PurR-regulated permease PerM
MADRQTPTTPAETDSSSASWIESVPPLSRILSVAMLILGIIAIGALFYKVMAGFFVPLFLAALLVVIFRPVHERIYHRLGDRPRAAAGVTTGVVLILVLLPIILIITVAATEFTAMVSHVKNFDDIYRAVDRGREQFGLSLEYPDQFRRLDALSDQLHQPRASDDQGSRDEEVANIDEAIELIKFLQKRVGTPSVASTEAAAAVQQLKQYRASIKQVDQAGSDIATDNETAKSPIRHQDVSASASIRKWMQLKLGGTFRSQVILLANPSTEDFKNLLNTAREYLQPRFVSLTSATGTYLVQIIIGLTVLVIALYFFLVDGSSMIHTLMRLSPLDDIYEERLLAEFDRTSRAVVLASVLSALVQGILAAIAYWFLGFDSVILLFLVTSLMALVPFLGAASVWVPCAIYLGAVEQRWAAAIGLAIFGAAVVSSIDNVIKMFVLHGRSTLHPLFALLSVLGGVKVFGPIGILVGPMVVVFLQTLLEILNHELAGRDSSTVNDESDDTGLQPERV